MHRRRRRGRRRKIVVGQEAPRAFPFRAYARNETISSGSFFLVMVAARESVPMSQLLGALDRVEALEGVVNWPDFAARDTRVDRGIRWAWEVFATDRDMNATRIVGVVAPLARGIFDAAQRMPAGAAEQHRLAVTIHGLLAEDVPAVYNAALTLVRAIAKKPKTTLKWIVGTVVVVAVLGAAYVATRGGGGS